MRSVSDVLLAILAVCAVFAPGCSRNTEAPGASRPVSAGAGDQSGYVGSERCGACHARNYHAWRGTKHANMLTEPGSRPVAGDFTRDAASPVPDKAGSAGGPLARMFERAGVRYVSVDLPSGGVEYAVAYVLGGSRRQMFLGASGDGKLFVLPVQWNAREGRWSEADGAGTVDAATSDWLRDCAGCHVTGLDPGRALGSAQGSAGRPWSENGIGCEACHGPGARHANSKNPEKPDTIFNPGNSHDGLRAGMVCGRCHTRGAAVGGSPYPVGFEPGQDFRRGFAQISPAEAHSFWPDGSSRGNRQQYLDFSRSIMFARGVTCWSCHNPHKSSENNSSGLRQTGDALCRSCHTRQTGGRGLTHAIHDNGGCRGCHMPLTAGGSPVGELASHRFTPVPPSATLELGAGDTNRQPNSCNGCHYHGKQPPADLDAYLKGRIKSHYAGQTGLGGRGKP